jgi:hypothetical protein
MVWKLRFPIQSGMVDHACYPGYSEAEAGGSWVPGQLIQHSETLSPKMKKKKERFSTQWLVELLYVNGKHKLSKLGHNTF